MPNTYSITIFNNSGSDQTFYLFQKPPKIYSPPDAKIFSNTYQSFGPIPSGDHSRVEFKMMDQFFAVCGSSQQSLDPNVVITEGSSEPVTLTEGTTQGTNLYLDVKEPAGIPFFDDTKTSTISTAGSFGIVTAHFTSPTASNAYLGIGSIDPSDPTNGIPTVIVVAEGGKNYSFEPDVIFYVNTGTYIQDELVNITETGDALKVDFTGATHPNVTFSYDNAGNYNQL
jgi:hypothetical protein